MKAKLSKAVIASLLIIVVFSTLQVTFSETYIIYNSKVKDLNITITKAVYDPYLDRIFMITTDGVGSIDLDELNIEWFMPSQGTPLTIATDGSPSSWFGYGTTDGEILVSTVDKPYSPIRFAEASRGGIVKLAIGVDNTAREYRNYVYIVAMDSGLYTYIFVANKTMPLPGWTEIGLNPNEAALSRIANTTIFGFCMIRRLIGENYMWDASKTIFALTETPGNITFKVVDVNGTSISDVIVEALDTQTQLYARGKTDSNGIASLLVPRGTYLVAAYHPNYTISSILVNGSETNVVEVKKPGERYNVTIIMEQGKGVEVPLQTTLSITFELAIIDLPSIISERGKPIVKPEDLKVFFKVNVTRPHIFKIFSMYEVTDMPWKYLLIYEDEPYVYLLWFDEDFNFKGMARHLLSGPITSVYVTRDGEYVVVGDGNGVIWLLKWYEQDLTYHVIYSYTLDSPITSLEILEDASRKVVVALSSTGLFQAIDIKTWTPLLRDGEKYLGIPFNLHGFLYSKTDASKLAVLGSNGRLLVMEGFNEVLKGEPPLLSIVTIHVEEKEYYINGKETGTPVADAVVRVYEEDKLVAEGITDANGNVTFYLPKGEYIVKVHSPEYGNTTNEINVKDVRAYTEARYELFEVLFNVTIPYRPEDPNYGYGLWYGPVPEANITITSTEGKLSLNLTTDANGIAGCLLEKGSFNVKVEGKHITAKSLKVAIDKPTILNINVKPKLYKLSIEVLDKEFNESLNNVNLTIVRLETGKSINKIVDAEYTFNVPQGTYVIKAYRRGFKEYISPPIRVESDKQFSVFMEPKEVIVVVRVVSEGYLGVLKGPVAEANVTIIGKRSLKEITDSEGYAIFSLREGQYKIYVRHEWFNEAIRTLSLTGEEGQVTLTINLKPKLFNVRVFIEDSEIRGKYLDGVKLSISTTDGKPVLRTIVSSGSTIKLPYSTYIFVFDKDYFREENTTVTVVGDTNVYVKLKPVKYLVEVVVYGSNKGYGFMRKPIDNAQLIAEAPEYPPLKALTDSMGKATLLLRAGLTYSIHIQHPLFKEKTVNITVLAESQISVELDPKTGFLVILARDEETGYLINAIVEVTNEHTGISRIFKANREVLRLEVPLGAYKVKITSDKHYSSYTIVELDKEGQSKTVDLMLKPIIIPVSLKVDNVGYYIAGKVIATEPPFNATLIFSPIDPELKEIGVTAASTGLGPDGTGIINLRPGKYKVYLISPYHRLILPLRVTITPETTKLHLLVSPKLFEVKIIALDVEALEGYNKLSNYTLTIIDRNGVPIYFSVNLTLKYNTIMLPYGIYRLELRAPGFLPKIITLELTKDTEVNMPLEPFRYRTLIKVYVDIKKPFPLVKPLDYGVIKLDYLSKKVFLQSIEAEIHKGLLRLSLRPGKYKATIYLNGIAIGEKIIDVTYEGQEFSINVTLPKYATIFRIYDVDTNVELEEAEIILLYKGGTPESYVIVKSSEKVELPLGAYEYKVEMPGYESASGVIEVNKETEVTLKLKTFTYSLEINVVNPDEKPIKSIVVIRQLKPIERFITNTTTDGKGYLKIENLRSGTYEVFVKPLAPYVVEAKHTIKLVNNTKVQIKLKPKYYNLTITFIDAVEKTKVTKPIEVNIVRKGIFKYNITATITPKNNTLTLPYGTYIIGIPRTIAYKETKVEVKLLNSTEVKINLVPSMIRVTIRVVDDLGKLMPTAKITVIDSKGRAIYRDLLLAPTGEVPLNLRPNTYKITAYAPGFKVKEVYITIPQQQSITIMLEPELLTKIYRLLPIIIPVTGIAIFIITLIILKRRVAKRLMLVEEYF